MNPTRTTLTPDSHLLEQILPSLRIVKGPDERGEYLAWCPFHPDGQGKPPHQPNLCVSERGFYCHACGENGSLGNLLRKLDILVPPGECDIETAYDYCDEAGDLLFQVVRMAGKKFRLRRPDTNGKWIWNLNGVPRVLYRLPDLVARPDEAVFLAEGEKDADRLHEEGLLATCNPTGAGKWLKKYGKVLEGRDVVILADNDEPGGRHALQVAKSIVDVTKSVKLVDLPDLPEKGDVSDWLNEGHTVHDLKAVVGQTPCWQSSSEVLDSTESGDGDGSRNESQADRLVALALDECVELFHDDVGETFARVKVRDHSEIWRCKSKDFKRWLASRMWESERKAPNSDAVRAALGVIEAQARFEGPEHELSNRVARHEGAFWYDLSDRQWQAVRITTEGWEIVTDPPILFRRHAHQSPQVAPLPGGVLSELLDFVNLREPSQELLLLVYVVSCLVPDIPHPIPVLHGPQGAAKTTLFRMVRRLIDPSATEALSFPRDSIEMVQQLSHHWAPFYDNVARVPDQTSDALCRAVTGEGFSKRELYSDDEDVIYRFRRCVGLNGINVAAQKPDLLDRCILFGLEPIASGDRKPEDQLWREFEEARPRLIGAIFDALSRSMRIRPSVSLTGLPRMADFALWGCAIAQALGRSPGAFLDAYNENVEVRNEEVLQASPVAACVLALMENEETWENAPSVLLAELEQIAERLRISTKAKTWPKGAHILARRLKEVSPNLAAAGIHVETGGRTGKSRRVTIRKRLQNSVTSVTSAGSALGSGLQRTTDDACPNPNAEASPVASPSSTGNPSEEEVGDDSDADDASLPPPVEPQDIGTWPEEHQEAYHERFAVLTVDGGLPDAEAHERAVDYVKRTS